MKLKIEDNIFLIIEGTHTISEIFDILEDIYPNGKWADFEVVEDDEDCSNESTYPFEVTCNYPSTWCYSHDSTTKLAF